MGSVEYAKLEAAALAHVDDCYYYGACCRMCKHSVWLSLVKLRAHLGDDFPLAKVKDRLRREQCKSRAVALPSYRRIREPAMWLIYFARSLDSFDVRARSAASYTARVVHTAAEG